MSTIDEDLEDEIIGGQEEKSELAKVVETLLNEKWKRRKTRLRNRTIPALTTVDTLAQIYDVKFLQYWIDGYTEYVTSEGGKGRQEIVDITKYTIDKETQKHKDMMEALGRR